MIRNQNKKTFCSKEKKNKNEMIDTYEKQLIGNQLKMIFAKFLILPFDNFFNEKINAQKKKKFNFPIDEIM